MTESTPIVAFDQHAGSVVAAVLLPGERRPALHALASDLPTISRFLERLPTTGLQCCYEAGPCGFALQRHLQGQGVRCEVIAPALIPRRVGNRVKTDRRDAAQLAVLYRAGALTPIHVPTESEEAVRDLLRCREDICTDLLRAKHRLSKFLLRHGRRCPDGRAWSKRYFAWLAAQRWPPWHYRHRPAVGHRLRIRQRTAPATAIRCAWLAQHRLHARYRRLVARGKSPQVAVTAVARELSAFVWAALTQ